MLADSMRWAVSNEESPYLEGKGLGGILRFNADSELSFLDIDLRGVNLSFRQEEDIFRLIDRARNVFVITSNQIYRFNGLKRIDFLHRCSSTKKGTRVTQVWFDGDCIDEIWKRVVRIMDANSTAVRDIVDVMGYTQGINVYTTHIKSQADVTNIRVPDGERVYLHDVQIKEDGTASGSIVHADKDFYIPSSTVEMFKAIGEINAK
jgi:hypothetical protein|nr:MAG TPA: hypothetical protein [Caudoviricetes sp.]